MIASFKGQTITHVNVQGNGESLYYALQEPEKKDPKATDKDSKATDSKPPEPTVTMGMNKIICSNMKINFIEGKVNNISFYIEPEASFIPPHELKQEDKRLKGFKWRDKEKPERKDVVQRKEVALKKEDLQK